MDASLPLPVLVGDLAAEGASGQLVVVAGETERTLFLREGMLVQARSRVAEETLGRLLVDQGWIGADDLGAALDEVGKGRQLGEVLIASGLLTPAEVVEALTEQVRVRFFACLRLRDFDARFEAGTDPPTHFQVKLRIPELVLEAVDQTYSVERVIDDLGLDERSRVRLADPPPPESVRLTLGPREARVVKHIGKGVSLDDLVGHSDLSYLHLLRTLYALWALRQIVIETPAAEPAAAPVDLDVTDPDDPARVARRRRLLERFKKVSRQPTPTPAPTPKGRGGPKGTGDPVQDEVLRTYLALERQSYFDLLGVHRQGGPSDVKIGYGGLLRRLSLESPPLDWPPRVKDAAAAVLDRAAEAFAVLSDPAARKTYEVQLDAGGPQTLSNPDPLLAAGIAIHKADRLRTRGRHADAAQILREALAASDKPLASLCLALGVTLYEWTVDGGRMEDEAARRLAEAVNLDPAKDEAWLYLGRLARHQKQPDLARKMFLKALMANRQSPAAAELKRLGGAKARPGLLDKLFGKGS